jgi:UDP-glucose 4-epimerase
MNEVFEKEKPFAVIHFAAFKAVGESVEQPLRYYQNNVVSLLNVLEMMNRYKVEHLCLAAVVRFMASRLNYR